MSFWDWFEGKNIKLMIDALRPYDERIQKLEARVKAIDFELSLLHKVPAPPVTHFQSVGVPDDSWESAQQKNLAKLEEEYGSQNRRR